MLRRTKCGALLVGAALFGATALSGTMATAGDVTMTIDVTVATTLSETVNNNLDFGTIGLSPGGDTIRINATGGSATPAATGSSSITGGGSGLVTFASPNAFTINVVYPATVTLNGSGSAAGQTVTVTNIANNSTGGLNPINKSGGASPGSDELIHVGGEIVFPPSTVNGPYSGTMTITFNYS